MRVSAGVISPYNGETGVLGKLANAPGKCRMRKNEREVGLRDAEN